MPAIIPYTLTIDHALRENDLQAGVYLVIMHARRIPPHIGMIVGGQYYSLSIKGQELNVPVEAFVRNLSLRKIAAAFIQIQSDAKNSDELKMLLTAFIQRFPKVEAGKATCLSPVKLFFDAAYAIDINEVNYVFDLLPQLEANHLITKISSLNIDENRLQLPVYSMNDINTGIAKAEQEAKDILRPNGN